MEREEVIDRIRRVLPDASAIEVQGADCNFTARVISDDFAAQRPVLRQQSVLAAFADVLADGRLHALTVETYTPDEWQAKMPPNLTQLQ